MSEDVLFDNFREDVSARVLERFKEHGVTLEELYSLKRVIPAIFPWDLEYDHLRYNVNRRFIFFPMMIVMAQTRQDVVIAFHWAQEKGIHMVPRSGAHCFESFSLTDGVIIDQSRRTGMKISGDIAKLEAGCLIGPVQHALAFYDLTLVGGTCPNTGVTGLTMGGGVGFLIRKYGLSSDNLLGITILLADGNLVKANEEEYPDLFWACRGAGNNNFGIVTSLTFQVHPISEVTIFDFKFKPSHLKEVGRDWFRWAPHICDELSAELDVYRDYVQVTGQYLGCKKSLMRLLSRVTDLCPYESYVKTVPFLEAVRHFAGAGRWFPFFENRSGFAYRDLPDEAYDLIAKFMKCAGEEDHVEINAFGGVVSRISSKATAFPHRKALAWVHLQCHWSLQGEAAVKIAWINRFYDELSPYLKGAYVNCADVLLKHPLEKYYGRNLPRLKRIKAKYDSKNIFWYPQSIPPS